MHKGWNVQYTTELTEDPWFCLRGEEYSAQIADFVEAVRNDKSRVVENDFRSAAITDRTLDIILQDAWACGSLTRSATRWRTNRQSATGCSGRGHRRQDDRQASFR